MRESSVPTHAAAAGALRRLSRNGAPKYKDLEPPLRRAVLLHWGSMSVARKALGLQQLPARRQRWSRELVIKEIVKLARSGQHMSSSALIEAGRSDLVMAASKHAGGWVRARSLAGLTFRAERVANMPVWDAHTVLETIKARHKGELPLASSKAPKALTCAARRIFGSWRDAVEAAGINYDSVLLLHRVGDDELCDWLRALARRKPDMTLNELDRHGEHAVVVRRRWGSFEVAAKAAGIVGWPLRMRRRAMSRAAVLRALRDWNAARRPLSLESVRRTAGGYYLINSVFHHFSTWKDGLAAAGLPLNGRTPVRTHPLR